MAKLKMSVLWSLFLLATTSTANAQFYRPSVSYYARTNLQPTSVTLRGRLTEAGGFLNTLTSCSCRFLYAKGGAAGWTYTSWRTVSEGSVFGRTVSGLQPNTRYYYHIEASNFVGNIYSSQYSFVTPAALTDPVAQTLEETNVTTTCATLRGRVTNDGGGPCQFRFWWRIVGSGTAGWDHNSYAGSLRTGHYFSYRACGLRPNTRYEYCADIRNASHQDYGSYGYFTTGSSAGQVEVETEVAMDIGETSARLRGRVIRDGGVSCQARFRYRKVGASSWTTAPSQYTGSVRAGNIFSHRVYNLERATRYQFYAQLTNGTHSDSGGYKYFWTDGGQTVTVPNVVGKTEAQARSILESAGFTVGRVTYKPSDRPAGEVLDQDPDGGTSRATGSVVDLWVSQGPVHGELLAHWKLDERSGRTAYDSTSNNYHGTLQGDPHWLSMSGQIYGALELDGDDCVDIGQQQAFNITGNITVTAWIKAASFYTDWQAIATKGDSAWRLHRNSNTDNLAFHYTSRSGEVIRADGSANVNDGRWHHVAGVYDGSRIYLYVDGQVDGSASTSQAIGTNSYRMLIGENDECRGRGWKGLIDDVQVYTKALTADQVRDLAEGDATSFGQAMTMFVDAQAKGKNDGSSWADAFASLQDALAVAQKGDRILVAEGVYTPDDGETETLGDREASFELSSGVKVVGGFPAGGATDKERDPALYETILSGDIGTVNDKADNSYHVVVAGGSDDGTVLDGFTIAAGNADGSGPHAVGGGMHNLGGNLTVANCVFTGNTGLSAAGVFNEASKARFTGCRFIGNAGEHDGGGLFNLASSPVLVNCVFAGNKAGWGAGLMNAGGHVTVTNCTFARNQAQTSGGAIENDDKVLLRLTNSILWDNEAQAGAQVSLLKESRLEIHHCCVQGGEAEVYAEDSDVEWGTGNITDDPLFTGVDGPDDGLGLSADSPCVDAGDALTERTPLDAAGKARDLGHSGSAVDIGAFEFGADHVR